MQSLKFIRSLAISKANRLQRAARHLESLRPAFAEWAAGEVYVCKKTGDYRYRFGDHARSVAPWSVLAREVFSTAEEFAFAALVLADPAPESCDSRPAPVAIPTAGRVDVIALAAANREAA